MILVRDMVEKDYEQKGYIHFRGWLETYDGLMDSQKMVKRNLFLL